MNPIILFVLMAVAVAAQTVSIVPGNSDYAYVGCYNETTGNPSVGNKRALAGGTMNASNDTTISNCLSFCGSDQYAGLEYGRECWCSSTLNSFANKLPDTSCTLPCAGDKTQACGGALTITTYQRKPGGAKSGAERSMGQCLGWGVCGPLALAAAGFLVS